MTDRGAVEETMQICLLLLDSEIGQLNNSVTLLVRLRRDSSRHGVQKLVSTRKLKTRASPHQTKRLLPTHSQLSILTLASLTTLFVLLTFRKTAEEADYRKRVHCVVQLRKKSALIARWKVVVPPLQLAQTHVSSIFCPCIRRACRPGACHQHRPLVRMKAWIAQAGFLALREFKAKKDCSAQQSGRLVKYFLRSVAGTF